MFPLERILEEKSKDLNERPHLGDDLFRRYITILEHLKRDVYPYVDSGLAAKSKGLYTLHNVEHFDEVVRYAGEMLECGDGTQPFNALNAYEIFALLVAIRIHDAGNAFGREKHEKRALQILMDMGNAAMPDAAERKLIAAIAEAHGGRTLDDDKDTIGKLTAPDKYGNKTVRPKKLAAILRFADEICESRPRAANLLLRNNAVPRGNQVYHKYASSITSVIVTPLDQTSKNQTQNCPKQVELTYEFEMKDAMKQWGKQTQNGIEKVFLLEEIFERLEKMFQERQYCIKFMRDICNIVVVRAEIKIDREIKINKMPLYEQVKFYSVTSEDEGYPKGRVSLREKLEITGQALFEEFQALKG